MVGAALKKIAVLLLSDQRVWKRVVLAVLVIIVALFLPAVAVVGIFSGSIQVDVQSLEQTILVALSSDEIQMLNAIENTMAEIEAAMTEAEMPSRVFSSLRRPEASWRRPSFFSTKMRLTIIVKPP